MIPYLNLEYFYNLIYQCLTGACTVNLANWAIWVAKLKTILTFVTLIFIALLIFLIIKIIQLQQVAIKEFATLSVGELTEREHRNDRWILAQKLIDSDNPSDWKLAIIEADAMLDEMVRGMGYQGDNLGERLKAIEVSDFLTLQDAWEAHKVRNRIAHDGANFILTKREARRITGLFEKVFNEFGYI